MVQTWKEGPGDDFACPHCGAVYAVTIRRYPMHDSDSATCDECGETMKSWNSTSVPSFTLKKRKDGSDV
jgi:transcription elongation factor Elf1